MMTDLDAKKLLLSCPGDTIQETIDTIGMSQAELAERLGRSIPKLNELIKGKAPITIETAKKLEYVLGIDSSLWLNLERHYQDELHDIEQMEDLAKCKDWVNAFPIKFLKETGILPNTTDKTELAEKLLKFFRIATPTQWSEIYVGSSLAFKIDLKQIVEPEAISVWLRIGELQSEKLDLKPYDKTLIRRRFNDIQKISFNKSENWMALLQNICAECGIALVYTPCISKAPIFGAARWIKNNTLPMIQLTDRGKDYAQFWFIFYHELAHILYHGKKDIFIDKIDQIKSDSEKEAQADDFAQRMLLSDKERNELFQNTQFDASVIDKFSMKFKKHPAIIVAQIQRKFTSYQDKTLNSYRENVLFEDLSL
jgi:HTH-type transcriptional regulator / antitoxin HigA